MTARPDLDTCRGEGITVIYILSTLAVTIGADDVSQSRVSKCQIIIVSWQIFVSFGGNFFPPASQVGAAAARSPPVAGRRRCRGTLIGGGICSFGERCPLFCPRFLGSILRRN